MTPQLDTIVARALSLCGDYFKASGQSFREASKPYALLNIINVYSDASWSFSSEEAGFGFIITQKPATILLAGHMGNRVNSPFNAELEAMSFALSNCIANGWIPNCLYCDCPDVAQTLKDYKPAIAWRANKAI